MDAMRQQLRGRESRLQAELEPTRELERAVVHLDGLRVGIHNRLLEEHRKAKAQLAAKKEALRLAEAAATEVPGLRTWLVEADQQRDLAAADNSQFRAEVERLKAEAAKAAEAHQAELVRLKGEYEKAAAAKDDELKAAVEKCSEMGPAARGCCVKLEPPRLLLVVGMFSRVRACVCVCVCWEGEASILFRP